MKTIRYLIFGQLLFMLLVSSVTAQDSVRVFSLSLEQATQFATEHNASVLNAELDIAIAKKKVWETTAIGLPQAELKGTFQYQFTVPQLQMGTLVPIYITETADPNDHYHELVMSSIDLGSKSNTTFDLTVSQLLFSGEYLVGLQASRIYKSFSERNKDKAVITVKETVAQTYFLVLVLEQNHQILDSSYTNMMKIQADMDAMYKQGFIEETDYQQISLTSLNLRNTLISLKRQVDVARNLLKLQLGINYNDNLVLTSKLEEQINESTINSLILTSFDINKNIDYQLVEVQEKLMKLSYQQQRSKFLPTLAAFYRHQEQLNAPDFNFQPPDVFGVALTIPLFSSGQRLSKVSQARMELEKVENLKNQVNTSLNIAFEKAKNDFLAADDKLKNQTENYNLAKKIYEKTLIKYREGVSSGLDLTQVQNQYFSAQSSYFQAVVELLNAKLALEKIVNQ